MWRLLNCYSTVIKVIKSLPFKVLFSEGHDLMNNLFVLKTCTVFHKMRLRKWILSKSLCHLEYHDSENLCIEKIFQKTLYTSLRSSPLQHFKFYMHIVDLFWYSKFMWPVQRTMYGFKAQLWTVSSGAQQIWNYLVASWKIWLFSIFNF